MIQKQDQGFYLGRVFGVFPKLGVLSRKNIEFSCCVLNKKIVFQFCDLFLVKSMKIFQSIQ